MKFILMGLCCYLFIGCRKSSEPKSPYVYRLGDSIPIATWLQAYGEKLVFEEFYYQDETVRQMIFEDWQKTAPLIFNESSWAWYDSPPRQDFSQCKPKEDRYLILGSRYLGLGQFGPVYLFIDLVDSLYKPCYPIYPADYLNYIPNLDSLYLQDSVHPLNLRQRYSGHLSAKNNLGYIIDLSHISQIEIFNALLASNPKFWTKQAKPLVGRLWQLCNERQNLEAARSVAENQMDTTNLLSYCQFLDTTCLGDAAYYNTNMHGRSSRYQHVLLDSALSYFELCPDSAYLYRVYGLSIAKGRVTWQDKMDNLELLRTYQSQNTPDFLFYRAFDSQTDFRSALPLREGIHYAIALYLAYEIRNGREIPQVKRLEIITFQYLALRKGRYRRQRLPAR